MNIMEFAEILKQHGPWIGACAFFIWQSWIREKVLSKLLEEGNKYIRETMSVLLKENTEAMTLFREVLKQRPCLVEEERRIDGKNHG